MKHILILVGCSLLQAAWGHDTWIQMNVPRTEVRRAVYADLMLGNHGNNHRDFKLASKVPLAGSTLVLVTPDGKATDLKPSVVDTAAAEKEGFWSARISPGSDGLHWVHHTYDAIVSYAPKRSIKGAKAFFLCGKSKPDTEAFRKPAGHPLEIIPLSDPTSLVAGKPLRVRVLFKGGPLKGAVVSCIPRSVTLAADFDPRHEARTDDQGEATLPLPIPDLYLVVTHLKAEKETGEGYSAGTEYSGTLSLSVDEAETEAGR